MNGYVELIEQKRRKCGVQKEMKALNPHETPPTYTRDIDARPQSARN